MAGQELGKEVIGAAAGEFGADCVTGVFRLFTYLPQRTRQPNTGEGSSLIASFFPRCGVQTNPQRSLLLVFALGMLETGAVCLR